MSIPALVINLAERVDRRDFTLSQACRFDLDISFVEAIHGSDVPHDLARLVGLSPGRVACWLSHRKAWERARDGGAEFALIMEDDVRWLRSPLGVLDCLGTGIGVRPDVLQLGSLQKISRISSRSAELARRMSLIARATTNLVPAVARAELWLAHRSQMILQARMELAAEQAWDEDIVWGTFGIGAHAYVIKTEIIPRLLQYNYPPFLATDDALAVLAAQRTLLVGSLVVPVATQAPLPSDLR